MLTGLNPVLSPVRVRSLLAIRSVLLCLLVAFSCLSPDGSSWLIEGYKNGIYHLIERASPDEKEDIFKIGKFMIKLSKIKVMEGHMY